MQTKENCVALSASRIKVFESCSWLYWCNYHLKLPQIQNEGAKKGEICHNIFEMLLAPKHFRKYELIMDEGSINGCPSVARLVTKYIDKYQLTDEIETFIKLDNMIMVGLKNDFFVKGAKLVEPEYAFDIFNENPTYRLKGFIDKPFTTKKELIIDDFKSSKKKFEGEDLTSNIQALMYSLAGKKIWPKLKPKVRFIFLQFPDDPIVKIEFNDDTLKGFEEYLTYIQKMVNNFNYDEARKNYAYDQTPKGGEFKGQLMCGFAKHAGELKKDGTKKWHCPFRFAFDYYVLKRDGQIITSAFHEHDLKPKANEVVEKLYYGGCPRHVSSVQFNNTPVVSKQTFKNVLDDF